MSKYYIVDSAILPDVMDKVIEAALDVVGRELA